MSSPPPSSSLPPPPSSLPPPISSLPSPSEDPEPDLPDQTDQSPLQALPQVSFKDVLKQTFGGPFSEAILERKNFGFGLLREWDERRCDRLGKSRNLIETVFKKLEVRVGMLKNSAGKVLSFFICQANNAGEFVHFMQKKMPKIGILYQENVITDFAATEKNVQTKIVDNFPALTGALGLTDNLFALKIKKMNDYKVFLDGQILILNKETETYEEGVKSIRSKISSLRKKLAKLNSEGASTSAKHARLFAEMMDPILRKSTEGKDLYNSERGVLNTANEMKKTQKELGEEISSYREQVLKLEKSRFRTIIQVFKEYLERSGENLGDGLEMREAREGWIKAEFEKDLEGFLEWGRVLDEEEEKAIMGTESLINLGISFFDRLKNFAVEKYLDEVLVLKKYIVQRDKGKIYNDYKRCMICFTVDSNLLIFDDYQDDEIKEADYILKIEKISAKPKKEPFIIEISEKVKGMIFNTTSSYYFKVEDSDAFEEILQFIEFVNKRKWE